MRQILGLQEMSAMGVGGVGVEGGVRQPTDDDRNENKQNKYNELYLYKEVLKRLEKKGIIK